MSRRARTRALDAKLRSTEDRYRALAESAVEAVFTADRKGRITYANSAAESLFGYAPGLLIGEPLTVLMPERYRGEHQTGLALVAATGRTTLSGKVVGLAGLRSDGTEFDVELFLEVWQSDDDVSFSAILRDVSQHGPAQEREVLVQAALRAATAATDLPAAMDGLARSLQRAFVPAALRYTVVDHRGHEKVVASWGRADPGDGGPAGSHLGVALSVGDRVTGRFDAWATPPAVLGAGQAALVERLAREVSGVLHTLHLLDQEREVAERLRDLDQLRSDFMAMVGHDLRSPMAVIAGYVDMMRGKWDEFGDADKLGFLDTIARNTAVLAELVDDVAQVVRLESEEVAPANQPVVVAEVIRQVLDEARVAHPRHHWVAAIDPRLPVVTTDPVSQWRILSNLAGNAARFSPPGSTVEIRATRSSGRLRVSVRDQGAGIAAEDLDKLFQRFSRVTQPGDGPQVKGTGLGLYICRLLVERHGGTIDVQSQAGAGSTFSYTIPLRPRPAGAIT